MDLNCAHLDVKLGNICISADSAGLVVKLIDLDRSAPAGAPFHRSAIEACTLILSCTRSGIGH